MILRRVIAHFRKQEWTAIAIDFVIVVVGVFVGIQVSNWNAARIERSQEKDYLVRLHEDFLESIHGQSRDVKFLDQQLSDQAVILKSLAACAVAPNDAAAFQRGINTLGFINPPRIFRRTVDEMTAAGKLDTIKDGAIKKQLGAVISMVEWRGAGYEAVARMTEHYRYIVEAQVTYDLERTYDDPFLGQFVGVNFDIQKLCQEPKTASAVAAISNTTQERQRAYAPILEQYQLFLPMLENELRRRWTLDLASKPELSK